MGFVILGHGQYRYHGDGAAAAELSARALVHGGKVGVKITGIAAASGYLFARRRYLAERLRVVCDVGDYDKHVHVALKRKILRRGQRHTGR